jgi:prenyltransferase beta subunit
MYNTSYYVLPALILTEKHHERWLTKTLAIKSQSSMPLTQVTHVTAWYEVHRHNIFLADAMQSEIYEAVKVHIAQHRHNGGEAIAQDGDTLNLL